MGDGGIVASKSGCVTPTPQHEHRRCATKSKSYLNQLSMLGSLGFVDLFGFPLNGARLRPPAKS